MKLILSATKQKLLKQDSESPEGYDLCAKDRGKYVDIMRESDGKWKVKRDNALIVRGITSRHEAVIIAGNTDLPIHLMR